MPRLALLPLIALTACAPALDVDQGRICRIVLPAISPAEAGIHVTGTIPDADGAGVHVDYALEINGQRSDSKMLHCRFKGATNTLGHYRIASVTTDAGPMPETQLYFLRRFWLETSAAWVSDPEPVAGADAVAQTAPVVAYALQQGLNALPLAALYGLLAAAYSLVYGLVGRINLAFGEFAAIGGYAAFFGAVLLAGYFPLAPLALALLLAAVTTLVHGVVAGRLVFAPLARASSQHGLVATVGLAIFLQEYLRLTQGASLRWISPILNAPFPVVRAQDFVVTVTPIGLLVAGMAALSACALLLILQLTRFGRDWRAYADDPKAAMLFGVNPAAIFAKTFALACALAGLAGYVMTVYYGGMGYGAATALGLKALVAAILGGIGSVPGAFLGGLAIGLTEAIWSAYFDIAYRDPAIYLILVALLMFRPGGFLGYADLSPRRV